ncbi:MAG: polysaccharide biosynthesis C-terminal domain-containing protein [Bacteroidota bacterium]
MNREFAGNAVLIVSLNLLVKSFYLFGIDRTVQNVLPEGEYGLYFTLLNFTFIFQIVSDFGLQNFNARNLSQSRQLLAKYFPHLLGLKLLLGLAFIFITGIVGFFWGFNSPDTYLLLLLIAFNQLLLTVVLFLRSNLAGLGLYSLDSWVSVLDKSLLVVIGSVLLWGPGLREHFQLLWFVLAHTLAYLITVGVLLFYLYPRLGKLQIRFKQSIAYSLLRSSAPFALVVFLMTAYTRLDAIMIDKLLANGSVEADRYASAFRLLDATNIAGYLLAGLLLPMFARQLKEKTSIVPLTRLGITTIWSGAIPLAISVYFFATPIMSSLYTDGNDYSGRILQWLFLTFIPMSGGYVYGTLLTANANLKPMNIVFAVSVLVNISLNYLLIPVQGAIGAALATFITQSLVFGAQIYLVIKLLKLSISMELLLKFSVFTLLMIAIAYGLHSNAFDWIWYYSFLGSILLGLVAAFILKLLDVKSWLNWLRF